MQLPRNKLIAILIWRHWAGIAGCVPRSAYVRTAALGAATNLGRPRTWGSQELGAARTLTTGKDADGRSAHELYLRRAAGLRARRLVRAGPATPLAADADVRPHLRNRGRRRRIWQGPGAGGA